MPGFFDGASGFVSVFAVSGLASTALLSTAGFVGVALFFSSDIFPRLFAAVTVWRDQAGHDIEVCAEGNALE
jgi:hypothetical protein